MAKNFDENLKWFSLNDTFWFCFSDITKILDITENEQRVFKEKGMFPSKERMVVTYCYTNENNDFISSNCLNELLKYTSSNVTTEFRKWLINNMLISGS